MQEIEVKAVLRDKDAAVKRLRDLGCVFSEPIRQNDTVYVEEPGDLRTFLSNKSFLRIRVNNDVEVIFTVKQRREVALVALEHEVKVDSKEEMERILEMLGFREALKINKARMKTEYDGCEICLDEVEGLGSFIEMERLSENGDPKQIQDELFQFFESIGIKKEDRVTKGYDILLLEKEA